jgi:diphosphomevalonate decarboxylase
MPGKATVSSPSNIAFIKYWGALDLERAIPANPSISMTLRECTSRTTVEHLEGDGAHQVLWRGQGGDLEEAPPNFAQRVHRHLDLLRAETACGGRFRVATENTFPAAAGMASSASGFSALTLAVLYALGREESPARRSVLARLSGSGSASRSVLGGYVEWPAEGSAADGTEHHAFALADADHWDLRNVIAVVETGAKETSSLDGHRRARTSPYWDTRQRQLPGRLEAVRRAIQERDFGALGPVVEAEAIDLHCVAMTSNPAIFYWQPGTLEVLAAVRALRRDGTPAYATMDAGANVHVLCPPEAEEAVAERLGGIAAVERVIRDGVGPGPHIEEEHLL